MLGKTSLRWLAILAGAAALAGAQAARAAVVIYSDAAAFKVAAGPIKAFSADGDVAHGLGVNFGSVVTPEALFRDSSISGSSVIDFHFVAGTTAFGGAFDRLPGANFSPQLKITLVYADGTREVLDPLKYQQDGFFGLTAGKAFTDIIIENIGSPGGGGGGGGGGGASAAALAAFAFDPGPPPPARLPDEVVSFVAHGNSVPAFLPFAVVPEPTAWVMMIGGLFGAGAMLRASQRRVPARA